jgi:hypothetical protein
MSDSPQPPDEETIRPAHWPLRRGPRLVPREDPGLPPGDGMPEQSGGAA